jgi:hypothetical protein
VPINESGSPVGPFKTSATIIATTGNNQALVGAPGAGNAIYVQTFNFSAAAGAAGNAGELHPAGGAIFSSIVGATANHSQTVAFPGGWELPTNTALQVDVIASPAAIRATVTYVIGAAV